ncbi:MAG TPA: fatty acid desaturase family protein [Burkholderiaceae bacterium]|nr:fatty acid desaturase family protein [Burkholderiaceae bacterium]
MSTPTSAAPRRKLSDIFSNAEIAALTARSDLMGWRAVLFTWGVIALCFVVLARWPHPLTWLLVILVLGGRQLSLAILMHDASHSTLFRSRRLNELVGDYACGSAIGVHLQRYRRHHLQHHARTGTADDTDRSLAAPFPTTPASLARKLLRDVAGISGLKRELGLLLMNAGVLRWTVASDVVRLPQEGRTWRDRAADLARNGWQYFLFQALLLGTLAASGHAWLYLAWLGAYFSTYSLYLRIRSMAEHGCTEHSTDMLRNTRTTRAGLLARATVAPLRVNFHIEHHLMPAVPYFRLPACHRLLRERGLCPRPPGYLDVLALMCKPAPAPSK